MQLPILAAPEDAEKIVRYLNNKVSGATIEDIKAAIDKKLVDHRKISAYVVWNLVDRDENKLKITERGRRLAQAATQEERNKIYIEIIRSNEAYYGVMEWAYNNSFDCLTNISVATYWHDNSKYGMENDADTTLKDRAVCLLKICDAAGLGNFCMGRRGMQTRIALYEDAIGKVLEFKQNNDNSQEDDTYDTTDTDKLTTVSLNEPTLSDNKEKFIEESIVQLPIPFIDGRKAVLNMPRSVEKDDVQYVFDMLKLMLSRQYGIDV